MAASLSVASCPSAASARPAVHRTPNATSKTTMAPEFFTTKELGYRRWRPEQVNALLGKPDAILTIRNRPAWGEPRRAFFRDRVEAAEQTIAFRPHEDPPLKMHPSWMTFRDALNDAIEAASLAYHMADDPHLFDTKPKTKLILRVDDTGWFQCTACGCIHFSCEPTYFGFGWCEPCFDGREPWLDEAMPSRIEQTQWGYKIIAGRETLLAAFPFAEWALPLATAIIGPQRSQPETIPEEPRRVARPEVVPEEPQRVSLPDVVPEKPRRLRPPKVIPGQLELFYPEQLELFEFAGGAR